MVCSESNHMTFAYDYTEESRVTAGAIRSEHHTVEAKQFMYVCILNFPVYCLQPPTIEHARHSALPEQATFDLDATVQYNCHTGYVTNGFPRAKCLAIDGQASWYGPDISCEREYLSFKDISGQIRFWN